MGKQIDKIRVSAGEDLLAFIPHIMGYWPERSIVCIGMNGKRLRATLRMDLPPEGMNDSAGFAQVAASQLASDGEADGCLIAIFGDEDWYAPRDLPQEGIYAELCKAFEQLRIPVRDAWYVGPNFWRSLECTNERCCPWPGKDNASIRESFVNTEFIYRGSMVGDSPRQQIQGLITVTDEAFAVKVAEAGEPFRDTLQSCGAGARQMAVTLGAWEMALYQWPKKPDASMSAFLLASLGAVTVRDAVIVSMATGPNAALAGAAATGTLKPDDAPMQAPVNWYGGNQAEGWDATIEDVSEEAVTRAAADFGNIVIGEVSDEGRSRPLGPDWNRLFKADQLLQFLATATDSADKAPVLCLLGWIEWCRGRGTWAGHYFHFCDEIQPGYRLAQLLDRLLAVGYVAACAKNPATAWHGHRDEEPGTMDRAA